MSDYLLSLSSHPLARRMVRGVGLPTPQVLGRLHAPYEDRPFAGKRVVIGGFADSPATQAVRATLMAAGADVNKLNGVTTDVAVYDATLLRDVGDLRALYDFFHALVPQLAVNARVLVLTGAPEQTAEVGQSTVWRAVEGFVRSLAKEIGKLGATANLAYVEGGADDRLAGLTRFLLSPRSAYVDGQPILVSAAAKAPGEIPQVAPLKGKVALITGAARGLGAATAKRMAEEGAQIVGLDIPANSVTLDETLKAIGGIALPMDVCSPEAPRLISTLLKEKFGGVDIVVHNAGVTRDKTIAKMDEQRWSSCLAVNLEAIVKIDRALIEQKTLRDEGRIVCLSSIAGIAGNVGQTNYAATKAGVIGYVAAQARQLAARGICVNAVAPGYIETRMMLAVPFFFREVARRGNSLSQGGVPLDVAELITFLSTPGAYGVTGQTIRVCGQNLIGA